MKVELYVKIDSGGFVGATKKSPTAVSRGEHVVLVELDIDDEVFAPVAIPRARITVPKEALSRTLIVPDEDGGL